MTGAALQNGSQFLSCSIPVCSGRDFQSTRDLHLKLLAAPDLPETDVLGSPLMCSGMTAKDTITAEMAFMFGERNSGQSTIDYPLEGSKGIVDALITGIEKYGGRILLRSHVEEVVVEGRTLAICSLLLKLLKPYWGISGGWTLLSRSFWSWIRMCLLFEGHVDECLGGQTA